MNSIHTLVESIFPIYIMKNLSNSSFTRNYYCFFIILKIIFSFNILRSNEKRISPSFFGLITITTTCSNLSHIMYRFPLYSIRTKFLYQFLQFAHNSSSSNSAIILFISARNSFSLATIRRMRAFNSLMSVFGRVSSTSI